MSICVTSPRTGRTVQRGETGDAAALRVCTVEAAALLLQELGEPQSTTAALVEGVVTNNKALSTFLCEEKREANRRRKDQFKEAPGEGRYAHAQGEQGGGGA